MMNPRTEALSKRVRVRDCNSRWRKMGAEQFDSRCDDDVDLSEGAEHGKGDSDPCPPCEHGLDVVTVEGEAKSAFDLFSATDLGPFRRFKLRGSSYPSVKVLTQRV